MRLRGVVLGLLVIWGFFAMVASPHCGGPAPIDQEPIDQPSFLSDDPAEVSQAYWLAARRVSTRCSRSIITRADLQRQAEAINSLADGKRIWSELAQRYSRAAVTNAEGVKELEAIPQDRVDSLAVECVSELAGFLTLQGNLVRQIGEECAEMAALFARIQAEGDAFDWDSPKGKEHQRRESDLTARMKRTAANESAAEKRRFEELAKKVRAAATSLAKKYGRQFPDLLGN
jgi:hypothetical protein